MDLGNLGSEQRLQLRYTESKVPAGDIQLRNIERKHGTEVMVHYKEGEGGHERDVPTATYHQHIYYL